MKETSPTAGVIWITGYSSAGKTTVGRKLEMKLRANGLPTIFFDGDDLRSIFANQWGYERQDRIELAKVYFRLCSHLAAQGFTVVIAAVAMYDEVRSWLKENVPNSVEAYLNVPLDERRKRDKATKDIYHLNKDFEHLYDEQNDADIVVMNYAEINPDIAADKIKKFYLEEGAGRPTDRGKNKYWNSYYNSEEAPVDASPFAREIADTIEPKSQFLEIGCGNGRDAAYFSSLGHSVTALDSSVSAINFCKKQYANNLIRFVQGTAGDLSKLSSGGFSVIYNRFCIHAMTPQEQTEFFEEARNLLKPDGRIFIECRSINDPLSRKGEVISPTERIFGHYRRFIVFEELIQNIIENGYEVVDSIESDGLAKHGDEDPVVIRVTARLLPLASLSKAPTE